MKLKNKAIFKKVKATISKCMALLLVFVYVLSVIPLTANASNEEPQIGTNSNAAEYITVTNNDVDYTADFRSTKEISIASNTRGSFGNIKHTGNVYYYSADVCVESDTSSYGSIRMILGTCTYSAYKRYIEVCIRPNLDGQAVIFLNGHGLNTSGEYAVKVTGPTTVKVGDTYRCTVKYDNGTISFWVDGALIFDSVPLPAKAKKVAPLVGFYSQNCDGKISDVKIWGNVEKIEDVNVDEMVKPVFDSEKDSNLIANVLITDNVNGKTYKCSDNEVKSESTATNRPVFSNILWNNNTYNLSFDAVKYDTDGKDWEGLIFKVATAQKDGEEYDVELRIRQNGAIFFICNTKGETPAEIINCSSPYGTTNTYTIHYNSNNKIYLWKDDSFVFKGLDLTKYGYTNIKPAISLGGEVCAFAYTNIKLWGEGITVMYEPEFDENADTNAIPDVGIEGTVAGTTFVSDECLIKNDANATSRLYFTGVTYDKVYNFSTKTVMHDNKTPISGGNEINWEGLIFNIGNAKKGDTDYKIEVRVRNGGIHVFALKNGGGEEVLDSFYGFTTKFEIEYKYTVVVNSDGSFDFWQNGASVIYGYKITDKGFEELMPDFGLGGEVCSFDFKEMKLWGKGMTVTKEPEKIKPEFNASTDVNVIPDAGIDGNTIGTTFVSEECLIKNEANTTSRLAFSGVTYGKVYNFSAKAVMHDNKNTTANGDEINWEGLIFGIGKAKKEDTDYKIEVRVRNGGIHIFAVKNAGGEELLESVYGIPTAFDEEVKYTVVFREDGSFDFWHNDSPVFYGYKVADKNFEELTPVFGLGGEVCSYDFKEMKLWGEVTVLTAPEFDSATMEDLIPDVVVNDIFSGKLYKLTDKMIKNTTQNTGRINFSGVKVSGDYTFFAEASFKDNKNTLSNGAQVDWEGIIFRAARAQKDKKSYVIEVRVRNKNILVYAVADDGKETLLLNQGLVTEYDQALPYVLEYKNGEITLWRDGIKILDNFRAADLGYTDISAFMGIGGEVCSFDFDDMHLVNKYAQRDRTIPKKPASNGDYGTVTEVQENSVITFNKGTLSCSDDKGGAKVFFQYLPFGVNDTYVFGCDVKVTKAEKDWMGPRFIFGKNSKGEEIALFFTKGNLLVVEGTKQIHSLNFSRDQGATYRFDMLIEPSRISVWVNDILLIDNVKTSPKDEAMTGVLFENTVSQISNITMYYTIPVKFFVPKKKPKPVLKTLAANQYNAAEFAKVTLDGKDFNGYFDSKLISNNNENGLRYMFKELPIKDSQSYYYSSTFNVSVSEANWKGPRYIYRKGANATMYCAITQTAVLLLADGAVVGSSPFELEIGRSYDIVIYSTPDSVSVWIDGKIVFSNVDLTKYTVNDTLKATPGVLFELCKAQVTDIAIYGDDIVFDPEYVDLELYNDKFFRMKNVPGNPNSSKNLFSNITMWDLSEGSLGAAYDDEAKTFKNDYSDVESGKISFVDANKSSNLNGLRNSSGYVFSFKYRANKTGSEKKENNGVWFISNSSTAPYLSTNCDVRIGLFEDSLRLNIYKDGQLLSSNETEFDCVIGREYDINIVHGKNWIKIYVDGKLMLVGRDLPEYKVAFDFEICNTSCSISDFELYEFEDTGLEILETAQEVTTTKAGKSVIKTESYDIKSDSTFPVIWVAVLAVLLVASGLGGVLIIRSAKRSYKK